MDPGLLQCRFPFQLVLKSIYTDCTRSDPDGDRLLDQRGTVSISLIVAPGLHGATFLQVGSRWSLQTMPRAISPRGGGFHPR